LCGLLLGCAAGGPATDGTDPAATATAQTPAVVFLVRHAEKDLVEPDDPELSPAGVERSALLAHLLSSAGIEHIWSTDTRRTRDTATPLAEALGQGVELYDPGAMAELAADLTARGGRHLIVGHSNTTPEAVEAFGGVPGTPIEEASEYDRLYVVSVAGDGSVETVLLRFGAPFGS